MSLELGMALKLIGGAAHLKVGSVTAEKLPITKMLDGGPIGALLGQALQGGPAAVMQNPLAAVTGQLQGAIGQAASTLSGVVGAAGLVSALTGSTGLSSALGGLSQAAGLLSGAAMPSEGQFGLLDAITHTSITDMLGDALPASMSLEAAIGPLNAADTVSAVTEALPGVVSAALSGNMTWADAVSWVQAQTGALGGITTASAQALWSAQNAAQALVSVSTASALLTSPDPAIQAILPLIVQPDALVQMQSAIATHVALPPLPDPA